MRASHASVRDSASTKVRVALRTVCVKRSDEYKTESMHRGHDAVHSRASLTCMHCTAAACCCAREVHARSRMSSSRLHALTTPGDRGITDSYSLLCRSVDDALGTNQQSMAIMAVRVTR